jgi:hypothetical protein
LISRSRVLPLLVGPNTTQPKKPPLQQSWACIAGFLKSKSGVVIPGQPGSQLLLAHQKYWLPITNRSLMKSSSKSFGVDFVVSL